MSKTELTSSNNGLTIPQIGFGTWQSAPGEVEKAVAEALKVGYRHIDCALIYQNQNEVADGIEQSGVKREEITLVSKLWNNSHRPENVEADLDLTLSQLRTSYLDVYLIHWPVAFKPGKELAPSNPDGTKAIDTDAPGVAATWKEMVRISKETKKVKAVGVSNFSVEMLDKIINATGVVPTMNQIECHPSLIQPELFKYCERSLPHLVHACKRTVADLTLGKDKGIIITAYSPLGNNITGKPRVIDAPAVQEIAKKAGKTPAQVLIAWGAHQGFVVIPKSVTPERIKVSNSAFRERQSVACLVLMTRSPTLMTSSCLKTTLRPSTPGARRTGSGRMLRGSIALSTC